MNVTTTLDAFLPGNRWLPANDKKCLTRTAKGLGLDNCFEITNYTPSEILHINITGGKSPVTHQVVMHPMTLEFYGSFHGHPFTSQDMTPKNIHRICCVHDAYHSVALFLTMKSSCDIAMHNFVPFSFPGALDYVKYYTQLDAFPLLVIKIDMPVEQLLEKNGVHKTMSRWCTRMYKIEQSRYVFKYFNLNHVTQIKGMTKYQSERRSRMFAGKIEDPMSQANFKVYQELPIFEMTEDEQLAIMRENHVLGNPYIEKYGYHGCMMCPFRNEQYYFDLKQNDPGLYTKCQEWRLAGSRRHRKDGSQGEYFYFRKSRIM